MSDSTINGLPAATAAFSTHEVSVNEAGTSKKVTLLQVLALNGDALGNQSTAAQSPTAATLTYIAGSNISVPVGKLRIGTRFVWRMALTKTAAGTAASVWHVRLGTAGTTADAAILTFTQTGLGTAVADTGFVNIDVTIRGPLSSLCVAAGLLQLGHDLQITGFSVRPTVALSVISGTFDATTANLIIGISQTSGASQAFTYQQVLAEAKQL